MSVILIRLVDLVTISIALAKHRYTQRCRRGAVNGAVSADGVIR